MKGILKIILYGLLAVALLAAGSISYLMATRRAAPAALKALESGASVRVEQGDWISFYPRDVQPDTGLVLYPGGFVDARAYAGSASGIAASGYLVILVAPPLATAFLAIEAAGAAIPAYPEIEHWAAGGHSLGGTAAARFAYQNPDAVDGLVLWAAYPAADDDLSARDLEVLSIYGQRDGLVPEEEIQAWTHLLPPDTEYMEIPGGNHAQFGRYGDGTQSGDNPAAISVDEQERFVVQAVSAFLDSLGDSGR